MKANRTMSRSILAAVVAATLSVAAPAGAQPEQAQAQPQESAPRNVDESKDSAPKPQERRLHELDRCKEEAHGKKGPDRARFLTDCLGSDRYEK